LREATSADYPLRLNTGRVRDQWHTMTRTGMSARLGAHLPEPFVEVHPDDAAAAGLTSGGFARVATAHGSCVVKVVVSEGQRPGSLFVPIHWSDQTASCARVGDLVSPHTDPFSGQPEAKATPAAIAPVDFPVRGYVRSRGDLALPAGTWWTRVTTAGGAEYRLATSQGPLLWHDFAHRALAGEARLAEALDGGRYGAAAFVDGTLESCLYVGPADAAPWDASAFSETDIADGGLAARISTDATAVAGPAICACFGVDADAVQAAVDSGAARSVAEIGAVLRAGTNCGSCLPELKRMIAHARSSHPH
jgi:assimilatory nitrate reductase catalytic subunit